MKHTSSIWLPSPRSWYACWCNTEDEIVLLAVSCSLCCNILFSYCNVTRTSSSSFSRQKVDRPAPKHMIRLTTWQIFRQVERRFHNQESIRWPLPWDLGISPPSSSSLRSSRTIYNSFSLWGRKLSRTSHSWFIWNQGMISILYYISQ